MLQKLYRNFVKIPKNNFFIVRHHFFYIILAEKGEVAEKPEKHQEDAEPKQYAGDGEQRGVEVPELDGRLAHRADDDQHIIL